MWKKSQNPDSRGGPGCRSLCVSKKAVRRGDHGSPGILHCKMHSPSGENTVISPSGNPKNCVFRRAISDRPYKVHCKLKFFDSLKIPPGNRRDFLRVEKAVRRGDHGSPADFAQAKSVAVRRKSRDFPFGKSEKLCFSAGDQ